MFLTLASWTLPVSVQKRVLTFLLKKAIGEFIAADIALDDLDVHLSNGLITLKNLPLNTEKFNDILAGTPVRLQTGRVGCISLSIPWTSLLTSNTVLTFEEVEFDFGPRGSNDTQQHGADTSGLGQSIHSGHSMLSPSEYGMDSSFMASSMIVAQEFLDAEGAESEYFDFSPETSPQADVYSNPAHSPGAAEDGGPDGLHMLARFIDMIVANLKIEIKKIRIRYSMNSLLESNSDHIEVHIPSAEFFDEGSHELSENVGDQQLEYPLIMNKIIALSSISVALYVAKPVPTMILESDHNEEAYTKITLLTTSSSNNYVKFVINRGKIEQYKINPQTPDLMRINIEGIYSILHPQHFLTLQPIITSLAGKKRGRKAREPSPHDSTKASQYSTLATNVLNDLISSGDGDSNGATGSALQSSVYVTIGSAHTFYCLESLPDSFNNDEAYGIIEKTIGLAKEGQPDTLYTEIGKLFKKPHLHLNFDKLSVSYESLELVINATIDDISITRWVDNSSKPHYKTLLFFENISNIEGASRIDLGTSQGRNYIFKKTQTVSEPGMEYDGMSATVYLSSKDIAERGRVLTKLPYVRVMLGFDDYDVISQHIEYLKESMLDKIIVPNMTDGAGKQSTRSETSADSRVGISIEGLLLIFNLHTEENVNEMLPYGLALEVLQIDALFSEHKNVSKQLQAIHDYRYGNSKSSNNPKVLQVEFNSASILFLNEQVNDEQYLIGSELITTYGANTRDAYNMVSDRPSINFVLKKNIPQHVFNSEHPTIYRTQYGLRFDPVKHDNDDDTLESYMLVDNSLFNQNTSDNEDPNKFLIFKKQIFAESLIRADINFPIVNSLLTKESYIQLRYSIDHLAYTFDKIKCDNIAKSPIKMKAESRQVRTDVRLPTGFALTLDISKVNADCKQYNNAIPSFVSIKTDDINVFAAIDLYGKGETYLWADIYNVQTSSPYLFNDKLMKPLKSKDLRTHSLVSFTLFAGNNVEKKESVVEATINVSNTCIAAHFDFKIFNPIAEFFKDPPGLLFEQHNTSDSVINVNANNAAIEFRPHGLPIRSMVLLKSFKTKADITAGQFSSLFARLRKTNVYIRDDSQMDSLPPLFEESNAISLDAYFNECGFIPVINVNKVNLLVKPKVDNKDYVIVYDNDIAMNTCADSFESLKILGQYIATTANAARNGSIRSALSPKESLNGSQSPAGKVNADGLKDIDENMFDTMKYSGEGKSNLSTSIESAVNYGTNVKSDENEHIVTYIQDGLKCVTENFFENVQGYQDIMTVSKGDQHGENGQSEPVSVLSVRVKDIDFVWNIHDGYDWEKSRISVFKKIKELRDSAEVPFDEDITSPASATSASAENIYSSKMEENYNNIDSNEAFLDIFMNKNEFKWIFDNGTKSVSSITEKDLKRATSSKINIKVYQTFLDFDLFENETNLYSWKLVFAMKNLELIDNVKSSLWNKFCSYDGSAKHFTPREQDSNIVSIILEAVKPDNLSADLEHRLDVRVLPLRLYIDQDALRCLVRFFSYKAAEPIQIKDISPKTPENKMFFQMCDIHTIALKVDYKPKYIDFRQFKNGNIAEVVNFFRLEEASLVLNPVRLGGVSGPEALISGAVAQWIPQLNTQIASLVSGVYGVRSIVNVGIGLKDLIKMPIQEYQRGKVLQGLHRGALSFAKATTMETIKLTTRLAVGAQGILEQADTAINETKMIRDAKYHSQLTNKQVSKFAVQPKDVKEGLGYGYNSIRANVHDAASSIKAVPIEKKQETTTLTDAMSAVLKVVPVAVIKPMIGTAEAVSKTLIGLQNTIEPVKRHQMEDKYKG